MALSDDLRERVVGAVVEGGMSRNAAAKRFGVRIASAVRCMARQSGWERRDNQDEKKQPGEDMIVAGGGVGKA